MDISITDTEGRSAGFEYIRRPDGSLQSKTVFSSKGFGQGLTEYGSVDGIDITGDMWRFLEGTVDMDDLYDVMNNPELGREFLMDFKGEFSKTGTDDEALKIWDKMKADRLAEADEQANPSP